MTQITVMETFLRKHELRLRVKKYPFNLPPQPHELCIFDIVDRSDMTQINRNGDIFAKTYIKVTSQKYPSPQAKQVLRLDGPRWCVRLGGVTA